jgi:hypothetical protein
MKRARTPVVALALLAVLAPGSLRAQVCAGFPSLRDTRFRVAASAASYTYATALGVSLTAGRKVFGTLGAGVTHDGELHASTYDLSLEGGADIAFGPERRVFLCPVAALSVSLGPHDFLLQPEDYRYVSGTLGLGLAAVAVRGHRLTVLPAGGLRAVRLRATRTYTSPEETIGWTESDTYLLFTLGVGLVFNEVLTIRPGVTVPFDFVPPGAPYPFAVPFGREEREVSLGISVGINFGRRTRSPPQDPARLQ